MTENHVLLKIQDYFRVLGYPENSIYFDFLTHRRARADAVVMLGARAAIVIEAKTGDRFPQSDDNLLPFDAVVRQTQFAALELEAPFYIVTNGEKFLWFETDRSGRPTRLPYPKDFGALTLKLENRFDGTRRLDAARDALRALVESSNAHRWSPEALPLLFYAYLQHARGDSTSYDYLTGRSTEPPSLFAEVHAFVLQQNVAHPQFYSQALNLLFASKFSELPPEDALRLVDELLLRSQTRFHSARIPRWTSDLMVQLAQMKQSDRVYDLNSGIGNLSAAIRLRGSTGPSQLTVFARHATDALWTVIQQLLFGVELPRIHIGDPLLAPAVPDKQLGLADCILVAPPFGVIVRDLRQLNPSQRTLTSEEAYLRSALNLLSPTGRIVALLPNGGLSNPNRASLRDEVLRANGLMAVLDIGSFLPGSAAATSAVVLDRSIKTGRAFFANARHTQQDDLFDCRHAPALAHVLERFDTWNRLETGDDFPDDESGLTAVTVPVGDSLNAGPYLGRKTQLELPMASFEHVPLQYVAEVSKGAAIRRVDDGLVPFIAPGAIRPFELVLDLADRTSDREIERFPKAVAGNGDIVVNGLSTYLAAAALIENGVYPINRHVFRIRADRTRVLPAYLVIAINSRYVRDELHTAASGSVMKMLTLPILRSAVIPIPPLSIQLDIVNRVNAAKQERDTAAKDLDNLDKALRMLVDALGSGGVQ